MKTERPNCYRCRHRQEVFGDVHSRCVNWQAHVRGNLHGVAHGWFDWPVNFDPVWVDTCDGFAAKGADDAPPG